MSGTGRVSVSHSMSRQLSHTWRTRMGASSIEGFKSPHLPHIRAAHQRRAQEIQDMLREQLRLLQRAEMFPARQKHRLAAGQFPMKKFVRADEVRIAAVNQQRRR